MTRHIDKDKDKDKDKEDIASLVKRASANMDRDDAIKEEWKSIPKDEKFQAGYDKLDPTSQKQFEDLFKAAIDPNRNSADGIVNICRFIIKSQAFDYSIVGPAKDIVKL